MVETRSQAENITVKKEEEEEEEKEDCKPALGLMNVHNTRSSGRIAKRRAPIINNRRLPAQQVKLEEVTDTKSLLKSPSKYSKRGPRPIISQEQINQLIHYIVNDHMDIRKASRKVNMSDGSGYIYYKLYKNNPEKRIPLPRGQAPKKYTQEQIGNLIRYINDDKMTVTKASVKADMLYSPAYHYYNKYLEDPNHSIPIPQFHQTYTKDQKNELIAYIVRDKMSIKAASKKAKMNIGTARFYYHNYFKVENPDIPTPSHIATHTSYTQEQIKEVVSYIVDDKIPIKAASRKANVGHNSARKYYQQYLKDNGMEIPVSKHCKRYTQEKIDEFIGYIVDDKMSVITASKKVNMDQSTGYKYYRAYLKDQKRNEPTRCPRVVSASKNKKNRLFW